MPTEPVEWVQRREQLAARRAAVIRRAEQLGLRVSRNGHCGLELVFIAVEDLERLLDEREQRAT